MPENTTKIDRSTAWGNPFVVGKDGTAAECVDLYGKLLAGYICLSAKAEVAPQRAALKHASEHISELRGRNLACWCREGSPCHGDILLRCANA